ncbi:HD-GYP domain-containing protein [Alkaliphilus peptidifermentans]|uniref:Diguanylate cyclase (GGDEF) domain-containing protein n=1 Tax=Alkaliphilus peptidifermentans DSM 18978 TaxID=1120976 RepID=A0A1G5F644_9FIRM|nr:diguanylate cyclase [Alkaliphilus peptidifermentans]SCY34561.1 diguanylate cyclase (GGDEF) domain-containing protein [Alkaliphilus peptidifermentans DSM 18978]
MMEFPSRNDFFLSFKALKDDDGHFFDYILVNISSNFHHVTNIKFAGVLGKRLTDLIIEWEDEMIGLKELHYYMIPKTRRKFEKYFEEIDRWYLISILSDDIDTLVVFYTDITRIKKSKDPIAEPLDVNGRVFNLGDKQNCYGYKDKLTGVYNRGFFEEELSRLDSARQLPISIIMGDLCGLKLINDAFGHSMGDRALKQVAELMKKIFRKEDIISRVGGDEFVVLLPQTNEQTAEGIVERIQAECSESPLEFININVSFGVATKIREDEDILQAYRKAEDRMYFNKLKESKEIKLSMIKYIKDKLEELTFETKDHYSRLKALSLMIASKLGLTDLEKEEIKLLCEFHDIGKVGISLDILHKSEPLNEDEWDQVRRHSEIGYHIIGASKENLAIDELILVHHERWDGNGYPGLLKRDEIPLIARIFAIADAYEAMVNERPYKTCMNNREALLEIENQAGKQFDPYLAKVFVNMMNERVTSVV